MINLKTVIGVIIFAILVGVLYVVFEKNFTTAKSMSDSQASSTQELSKDILPQQPSLISLPSPEATLPPINESSDLLQEAEGLQMRDYSSYFEELKESVSNQ